MRFTFVWAFGEMLQEFKVLECFAMFVELYVGLWLWWAYEWWIYNVITSYIVENGEWICDNKGLLWMIILFWEPSICVKNS